MEADGLAEVCASRRSDIPANPVGHEDGGECHGRRSREGHERGAVDDYSRHHDYIPSASSPSILDGSKYRNIRG